MTILFFDSDIATAKRLTFTSFQETEKNKQARYTLVPWTPCPKLIGLQFDMMSHLNEGEKESSTLTIIQSLIHLIPVIIGQN